MKVLIVDDDADVSRLLKAAINKDDFEVATASSGEDALMHLAHDPVDIVITDLNMPGINGLELTAKIVHEYANIDVIMLTSHPTSDAAFKALKAGVYDYLNKPIEIKLVKAALKRCQEKRALSSRLHQAEGSFREAANTLDVVAAKIADLDEKVKALNLGPEHETCRSFAQGLLLNVQSTLTDLKKAIAKPK